MVQVLCPLPRLLLSLWRLGPRQVPRKVPRCWKLPVPRLLLLPRLRRLAPEPVPEQPWLVPPPELPSPWLSRQRHHRDRARAEALPCQSQVPQARRHRDRAEALPRPSRFPQARVPAATAKEVGGQMNSASSATHPKAGTTDR